MSFVVADRTLQLTTTTGATDAFQLTAAVPGYQTFLQGVGSGNQTSYVVKMGDQWEIWYGTVNETLPVPTVSRDHLVASSSGGSAIAWGTGAKTIYCCTVESSRVLAAYGGVIDLTGKTLNGGGPHAIDITGNAATATLAANATHATAADTAATATLADNATHATAADTATTATTAAKADKWSSPLALSLTGDVEGSVSFDQGGSAALNATVKDDSHTHDERYYKISGGAVSGVVSANGTISSTGGNVRAHGHVTAGYDGSDYGSGNVYSYAGGADSLTFIAGRSAVGGAVAIGVTVGGDSKFSVNANGSINMAGNVNASGNAVIGGAVVATGSMSTDSNLTVGTNLTVSGWGTVAGNFGAGLLKVGDLIATSPYRDGVQIQGDGVGGCISIQQQAARSASSNAINIYHGSTSVLDISYGGSIDSSGNLSVDGNIYFGGVYNGAQSQASANVVIGSSGPGRLYRASSAKKYKRDIEPIDLSRALTFLDKMQPVWFRSTCEADNPAWSWYGYIADEAVNVEPRLVQYNDKGEPEGFSYDRVAALLHLVVKDNRARIAALEAQVAALTARLSAEEGAA